MKLMAIVVLYNPNTDVINNIKTYCDDVDCLYVADNSEAVNLDVKTKILEIKNVRYESFGKNMGIAYALNRGKRYAENYDYLLTMDQDTSFGVETLNKFKEIVELFSDDTVFAFGGNCDKESGFGYQYVETLITSGMILRIDYMKKIGDFDEKLFIDEVDNEYCYRAHRFGYRTVLLLDIHLNHQLGECCETVNILGKRKKCVGVHSPLRMYYITRNKIYVMRKYPKVFIPYALFIKSTIRRLLFGYQYKRRETSKYVMQGIIDALRGKMGRYIKQ